ncbi:MAG: hypothetical protein HQK96_10595 [Nitrospirae bacterium]|nr:hypothetical protein [Nitrospirota bacterium]
MFTVTFYSYKGGVGRTLALLNSAYLLAKASAKVAIIDFDLEAPGIDAINPFGDTIKSKKGGIVEYISAYTKVDNPNPDELTSLIDYSYPVKCETFDKDITIIPAGLKDGNYQNYYSALNWSDLYEVKYGYYFFENLKKKIIEEFNPDYLLVDSRTGLADVAGITMHQLADLVVLVFNLNQQNMDGIIKVYHLLFNPKRKNKAKVILVASPVPMDIMPDYQRYEFLLAEAQSKMSNALYDGHIFQLDYNPRLAFDDIIFTKEVPESRLAEQYSEITMKIREVNKGDILYYTSRAEAYIKENNIVEADGIYKQLLKDKPHDERVYVEYVVFLINRGLYPDAMDILKEAPRQCEVILKNPDYHFQYGVVLYRLEDYDAAFLSLKEAEKLKEKPLVLELIANIYYQKGDITNYISYIKEFASSIIRENKYLVGEDSKGFDKLADDFLMTGLSIEFDKKAFIDSLKTRDDFTLIECIALLTVILKEKFSQAQLRQLSEALYPKDKDEVVQDFGILAFIDIVDFTPQSLEVGELKTSRLLKYYYEEISKAAKSCDFEFIKSVGDAVLLFGKKPKDFLTLVNMIFVDQCVPGQYGFELRLRMVANAGFYHFIIDKQGGKDPVGSETIKLFRLEKLAQTWEVVVLHELFAGLRNYLDAFKIKYLVQQWDEPLKGFEFLGATTAYYRLIPPVKAGKTKAALSDQYKAMRLKLYGESISIPVFAKIYREINMEDNFLDLSLDKDFFKGTDYLSAAHYKERRHEIQGTTDEDYEETGGRASLREDELYRQRRDDKTIKASEFLALFNKGFIFGLPGAGKTTMLKYIAYQAFKQNLDVNILFVNCRDLHEDDLPKGGMDDAIGISDILSFLTTAFLYPGTRVATFKRDELEIVKRTVEAMFQAWQRKELIVAIDALDESQSKAVRDAVIEYCRALMAEIQSAERDINAAGENIVYATSRIAELQDVGHLREPFFYINPITQDQMRAMARHFWGNESLLYKKFDDEIWQNSAAQKLGGTPLTAMLLLFYYEAFREFGMRCRTYDIIMKFILKRIWEELKRGLLRASINMYEFIMDAVKEDFLKVNPEIRAKYDALSSLAFDLLYKAGEHKAAARTFNEVTLREHLLGCLSSEGCVPDTLNTELVNGWISVFKRDHLLIPAGPNDYIFLHSTVMEFLAGRYYASNYLEDENGRTFDVPFRKDMESLEVLPIAAGDDYKTGAEILNVMSRFYEDNRNSTLPFRCLSETEAVENYVINKLGTDPLREKERNKIDKLLSKKEWAYCYVKDIVLKIDEKEPEKLRKQFSSLIPLCRNKLFDYLEGWELNYKAEREAFLKVILEKKIFESHTGLKSKAILDGVVKEIKAKGITSYLQFEGAGSPFDTNFTYYEKFVSYESEKAVAAENRRKILIGFYGSPNFKHSGVIFDLAMSPDRKFLATASGDFTLKLWDLETSRELKTFFGHQGQITVCIFTKDGSGLISGSWDNTLKQWDIKSGEVIRTFSGHKGAVYTCIQTQDGSGLISGSWDNTLKQWDIKSGEVIRTFTGHQGLVYTCIVTQDGSGLISGSWDMTLKVWEIATGKLIDTIMLPWIPRHIAHVSDRPGMIVTGNGNGTLTLLDVSGV